MVKQNDEGKFYDVKEGIDCKFGRLAKKGLAPRMNCKESGNGWVVFSAAYGVRIVCEEASLIRGANRVLP